MGAPIIRGMDEAMPHILIVEDDAETREDLAFLLRHQGFEVTTAANGLEALEQVRTEKPCIILLDLMMPVMDGWQFRTKQLAEPDIATVPVIVISGVADRRHHPAELNAVAMLAKPIEMERLLDAVRRLC
jgi:CheY-like chemotaxis protein